MKIVTILGTRPEIIRLSIIIEKLDQISQHILVHTGQNYDPNLNDVFFQQLGVRDPDVFFNATGTFGAQVGKIFQKTEKLLREEQPDKLLILGDTNSALSAFIAKRFGIPVYHMEAGNRCFDDRVPEEVNRRIIDHSSDILMPYTERSRQNLLREGFASNRIYVTGNPIFEVINRHLEKIKKSPILDRLGITSGNYFLVTLHRAENVDIEPRLRNFISSFELLQNKYNIPLVVSTHPRTRNRFESFSINIQNSSIMFLEPFGFFDFVALETQARCVLSDSGTVQEECAIFHVPNVTLRDVTERPETVECGSNILAGADPDLILKNVEIALSTVPDWSPPAEYMVNNVSQTVLKILAGYNQNYSSK